MTCQTNVQTNSKRGWQRSIFSQTLNTTVVVDEDLTDGCNKNKRTKHESFKDTNGGEIVDLTQAKSSASIASGNWIDIFEPKTSDELALHAKKYAELQQWFLDCNNAFSAENRNKNREAKIARICLITGPAGAGKTAAVRVLSNKFQFQLQEWINPLDQEAIHTLGDQDSGEAYLVSHLTNFKSFLFHASRYKSLLDNFDKRLLLVEDFPNALLKEAAAFEEILSEYLDYGRSPLIFIVSDTKSRGLNISYNLFPDEVKQKYSIAHISFNPIANTLMQKAMKRFGESIQKTAMGATNYKTLTQNTIDSIILSAQGDIRNAMINYHFAALKGAPDILLIESKVQSDKGKTRSKKQTSLKSVGRDESITMLHALGRVFNPKYNSENVLVHSPEDIAESFSSEPKKFLDFLHANSLKHFSEIEHTVLAADSVSEADVLLQEYRSSTLSTIGLNIATRGLMLANRKPVSGWLPVRGPKRISSANQTAIPGISPNVYALDYATFVRLIAPSIDRKHSQQK